MFEPLPTPAEMAVWDQSAIKDFGLKAELLMENAGAEALTALQQDFGPLHGVYAVLIAGGGNNGGDAFVVARRLLDEGAIALVLHTKPRGAYKGAARYHLDLARRAGVELRHLPLERAEQTLAALTPPDILVDGLMGTGFSGALSPEAADLVSAMNRLGEAARITIGGRHDICAIPRIVPVLKAMALLVLGDFVLLQRRVGR